MKSSPAAKHIARAGALAKYRPGRARVPSPGPEASRKKRISGQQNYLRRRMSSVRVHSCADGKLVITPWWRFSPGVLTRLGAAEQMERLINAALKVRRG